MSLRIIIADDHKNTREILRAFLEEQTGMEVIAEAEDGIIAVKLSSELKPDVVIMDINMPNLDGIEATRRIVAKSPDIKVIALSTHSERVYIRDMLSAGASGYVLKISAFEELDKALHTVINNQTYLSPEIVDIAGKGYLRNVAA